jgi:hypothetical protein
MASRTLTTNGIDEDDKERPQETFMEDDEITETAGSNRGKIDAEEQEKNIKWQMPGHHDVVSAKRLLVQLLGYLTIYHPGDVTVIDSKQQEWTYDEAVEEDQFLQKCQKMSVQLHPIKNKQQGIVRWVAVTRVHSISTIQDWKNNDHFYSIVNEAETYLFPHPFGYDEWDTTSIGFIKDIHAIHYPRELLHEQLNLMIKKQNKNPPRFQLIPQRITTTDKKASTKAYTVQCLKDDASQLIQLLTHGPFRSAANQIFVPFKYKTKKPDVFKHCIRQQNEVYHKTWIIKLEGITPNIMDYIKPDITKIMGVFHIVPSRRVNDIGEWKILADQTKCAFIHRQLTDTWKSVLAKVPQQVLDEAPSCFAVPAISSKRAREYQDSDSDNDSYGSLLTTGTEMSVMTTDDSSLNDLPEEYKIPSYASAANNSSKSGQETQVSSPTNSTGWHKDITWQKEKQELEAQIKQQAAQIDKIQADLQAKESRSKDLEDQLAKALDLAHSRDERHQEMLDKFAILMKIHTTGTNMQLDTDDDKFAASQPTTPDRMHVLEEPPPPKKANTNSSPHRHIYSLFRPPPSKQALRNPTTSRNLVPKKQAALLLTQPMETDEDTRPPQPGAKSGHKTE